MADLSLRAVISADTESFEAGIAASAGELARLRAESDAAARAAAGVAGSLDRAAAAATQSAQATAAAVTAQGVATQGVATQGVTTRAVAEARRSAERVSDDLVRFVTDAFVSIEHRGAAAFDSVWDGALASGRRFFVRLAAEAFLRPIVLPVVAELQGQLQGQLLGVTGAGGLLDRLDGLGRLLSGGAGPTGPAQLGGFGLGTMLDYGLPVVGSVLPGLLSGNPLQAGLGGAGSIAGAVLGGPVGAMIGGTLGNLIGSLFSGKGPRPDNLEVGVSATGTGPRGAFGRITGDGGASNEWLKGVAALDTAVAALLRPEEVATLAAGLQAAGPFSNRVERGREVELSDLVDLMQDRLTYMFRQIGAPDALTAKFQEFGSLEDLGAFAVSRLEARDRILDPGRTAERSQIAGQARQAAEALAAAVGDLKEAAADWGLDAGEAARSLVDAFLGLEAGTAAMSDAEKAMAALNDRFEQAARIAAEAGITEAQLAAAREAATARLREGFLDDTRRAILAITDPLALALEDFDRVAAQRLEDARTLGVETVLIERRNALERQKILEQFAAQATNTLAARANDLARDAVEGLSGLADKLRFGSLSPLPAEQQLGLAETEYRRLAAAATAGDFGAIRDLPRAAERYAELMQRRYGTTEPAVDAVREISSVLDRLASRPATDLQRLAETWESGQKETTRVLADELQALRREVEALRRDVRTDGLRPARLAS